MKNSYTDYRFMGCQTKGIKAIMLVNESALKRWLNH